MFVYDKKTHGRRLSLKALKVIPQVSKTIAPNNNRDPEKRKISHGEIFNNILQGEIRKLRRKDESKM